MNSIRQAQLDSPPIRWKESSQHFQMPFTQADLDALDAARKQGARRVRFQDREFEFDSIEDYLKLRNLILNDIAQQTGPQQVRQVRIYTTNGWGQ